jgi:hypothetical protein
VSLEEAYRKLRVEYKENLGLLLSIKQFVDKRLQYLNECRDTFKKVLFSSSLISIRIWRLQRKA